MFRPLEVGRSIDVDPLMFGDVDPRQAAETDTLPNAVRKVVATPGLSSLERSGENLGAVEEADITRIPVRQLLSNVNDPSSFETNLGEILEVDISMEVEIYSEMHRAR